MLVQKLLLVQLNILNITFKNKPRFHAEANFGDILVPEIYKTVTLSGLLS